MKAALYERFGERPEVTEVPDPAPSKEGVVLEVRACGVCRSDWFGWQGYDADIELPHVPGHEISGTVVAVGGEVSKWRGGERVTVPFVGGCGRCELCLSGNQQVCDFQFQPGFTAWGGFAEYVAVDYADENLVALPDSLGFVEAASLGCRFVTAFRGVVAQGQVSEGDRVAVFGCGGVGLSAILIAKALGATVIAVDINDENLELASDLGADTRINSAETARVAEEIADATSGGVDVSLDCIGNSSVVKTSVNSLRKLGKHIQLGLLEGNDNEVALPVNLFVAKEIEFIGSHGIQAHRYPDVFEILKQGIDPGALIKSELSLEEGVDRLVTMNEFAESGIGVISFEGK